MANPKNPHHTQANLAKNSGKRDGRKGLVMELFVDPSQGQDSVEVNG